MSSFVVNRRSFDEFGLRIDFERNSAAPSRVFRAMSSYIDSFEFMDRALLSSITPRIQPVLLLEDIEAGSILAWLRNTLESVDDEALKSGDYKKLIGAYLVRGKKAMIDFIAKRTTVETTSELQSLQSELLQIAEHTDVLRIPTYRPVPTVEIARSLKSLGDAPILLMKQDSAEYLSEYGQTELNLSFSVSPKQMDDLLVREQLSSDSLMILRIKKPDFLGESMWEFVHGGRTFVAKILDLEWIQTFRSGNVMLFPGDSLRTMVRTTVKYGFDNEVVNYDIGPMGVDKNATRACGTDVEDR